MGRSGGYRTIGAVVRDLGTLAGISGRATREVPEARLVVLARRRDRREVEATLPEAEFRALAAGLTRAQKLELGSAYLGVTAVSVLMGAVHLPTGVAVQLAVTLAVVVGLFLYTRRPRIVRQLVGLGLPQKVAERWQQSFDASSFALALLVAPDRSFDDAHDAFLADGAGGLREPLVFDRRPVL
ncbi:Hypothetical Protein RradSPS_2151 [Rubrobacter radiotolerans]|uniref:Uncharacterized protein n=1 Tax=Rubrobacter radiotolerans TaxID=42256 RepID=A0A023X5U2_RUBRA|nr:hypothetical protein [Rubrobacter radiotolerans]AHY47434.1 Hypothetical Protein RradSPS_2151 [Rubrobacter radiotolerans]MDX5894837.1 hypothetical protein [Rubrobacter radiotolerans]SMC06873.1 conserved hypothetical protein [Rubrobacter radiotolerans DSM 5868]